MIPLAKRSGRSLGTTLLSCSRQALPRPARLYSSPSKRVNAPALATSSGPGFDYPAFMPPHPSQQAYGSTSNYSEMESFLQQKRANLTLLPTPLPSDQSSPRNDLYFTDSPTQDAVSIIDACLHNLHDVPRAKEVFEQLRNSKKGDALMDSRLYNSFLDAYVQLASQQDSHRRSRWVEDACELYESMEFGKEKVHPTANTYATMLRAWILFSPESSHDMSVAVDIPNPEHLLRSIVDRQIAVPLVIADRAFRDSEEAAEAIKLLSKAAVNMHGSPREHSGGNTGLEAVVHAEDGSVSELELPNTKQEVEYQVPFNLDILRKHLSQIVLARRVLPEDAAARQKLLEESVYDVAVERLKHQAGLFDELGLSRGLSSTDLRTWLWEWHQKLQFRLAAEIQVLLEEEERSKKTGRPSSQQRLGPFLTVLTAEKLSLITILEFMHLQSGGASGLHEGMKTARAILSIAKAVELEHKAQVCKKNNITIPNHAGRPDSGYFSRLGYRDLHARRVAARKHMEDSEEWTTEWSQQVRIRLGGFLVDQLIDVATVTRTAKDKRSGEVISEEQPAFFHSYEYNRGQKLGVIKLNVAVAERLARDPVKETLHPRHLPMLVPPKPWLSHDSGGYLYNKTSVMRYKDCQEQQTYLREAAKVGNVELIFAGLDVLGSTPWQINREVFDIVLKVWNTGDRMGKIPPAVYDQAEPQKPPNFDVDPKAKNIYLTRQKSYFANKANNHSDRCSVNYKIEIARTFLGDTIYMPHNIDFRGRAYPIPPHLNHIGDDLSRGLLKFGESKPLGERGLRWLKIHISNLYGFDKANFDEREQFTDNHLEDIRDSALDPLEGKRWWTKADDPWQCLAACFELHHALESGDPHSYLSALPVHQDGTCNGLQHYAALGGDARGAQQVNLDVADRPSDVYTYVSKMVEEQIEKDVAKGDHHAKLLSGKITRKVVKQTVMTTVYGVTFVGARDQIHKQLRDRGDIPEEDCWLSASYLAKIVLGCIGDLFTGAKDIQTFLNINARLISKSIPPDRVAHAMGTYVPASRNGNPVKAAKSRLAKEKMTSVIWTTPLGLPIVQPYRQVKRKQIMTALQTVFISDPSAPSAVNTMKQASAFPPNFIHSLDATHMMLTALECRVQGITFASVHDSYWSHACSVDQMSGIIRDTFIALHSSEVLKRLHEEFKERYKGYKIHMSTLRETNFRKLLQHMSEDELQVMILKNMPNDKDGVAVAKAIRDGSDKSTSRRRKKPVEDEDADEEDADSVEAAPAEEEDVKDGRFIDVTDLLPPVPAKGQFDVSKIKKSLYFFS